MLLPPQAAQIGQQGVVAGQSFYRDPFLAQLFRAGNSQKGGGRVRV